MKGKTAKGTIELLDVSGNDIIYKDEKGKEKLATERGIERKVKKWLPK